MKTINIILADDHQIIRDGIRRFLEDEEEFCVVGEADNGLDVVTLARQLRPDVVVMDITMPGLNGIESTRKIMDSDPKTRIIGLSQHMEARFVAEMIGAGASGYVPKKCATRELVLAIRTVTSGRTYLSPEIAGEVMKDYTSNRDRADRSVFTKLSGREREVLQLIAEGLTSKEIAARLHVSHRTANTHRENIMRKLDIDNLANLVKYAVREGITSP